MTIDLVTTLPLIDAGGSPGFVRDYAQAAEALGYQGVALADHVLGVNVASRPDWGERNTSADYFHDPFVLFGFLAACTTTIEFSTQVMILPQRQTVLAAKQAASLAVLSEGRFRFGIGSGWNPVEYVGLNEDFTNRGRRITEQVEVMRRLWAQDHVTFDSEFHHIDDAGINPRPPGGSIPIWFGGHHERMVQRAAELGDGWIMLAYPPDETAIEAFDTFRRHVREAGRDPADVGIEIWTSFGDGDDDTLRAHFEFWKQAGVTHVNLNNFHNRGPHKRMQASGPQAQIDALERYRTLVDDLL